VSKSSSINEIHPLASVASILQGNTFQSIMCSGNGVEDSRPFCRHTSAASLQAALAQNRAWAQRMAAQDETYFKKLALDQTPEWLWIGCSDSRVPANELLGMGPGEVFVQRNVGNLATHKDMNVMSCLEYAVSALKVKHVIVCGHYRCGAVRAALSLPNKSAGLVNLWIQDIRDVRDKNVDLLRALPTMKEREEKLVELNVMRQVFNVCTSPTVQQAWDAGQPLAIHGLVYSLEDGLLKELTEPITSLDDLEHYTHEKLGDLRHLSLSVLTHMSFEREALKRASMDGGKAIDTGKPVS
jgi:carbonic anhydrase